MSDSELFLSNHVDIITPESIQGRVKVIQFDEYHQLDEVDDDVYFTRYYIVLSFIPLYYIL